MIAIFVPGRPVPWARARSKGAQRFTAPKQRTFMERIKAEARAVMDGDAPFDGPLRLQVRAVYSVPQSWSKKKKAEAYWKTSKPDSDNLEKIAKDALNGVVWRDDAQVSWATVQKVYGPLEGLTISVETLQPPASGQSGE
ncbi:MAG: RusA family crossover junction endodeoxyribonuclease [Beijerinckiaceae bacterium]|nr:RusA family crossover junction endodeoxyribonuclease [Beijerinckiaceae bacterium]